MNKKLFTLLSGVAIITSASLQSCADEFDPAIVTKQDAMANEYAQNFVNRYGTPDPNHTWGMGKIESMGFFSKASTRAGEPAEGKINVNRNEWTSRNNGASSYNSNALINDVKVPGWPNFDGFYYASKGQDKKEAILTETQMWTDAGYRPVGDVTDYEIKYVSNWFRTHPNPTKTPLHLTDFFIQNISADADQIEYKEYTWPSNGTMPTDGGYNGANVERASDIAPNGSDLDACRNAGTDYKKGNITRRKPNYADENINYSVDQLKFKAIGASDEIGGAGWTHVNNFMFGKSKGCKRCYNWKSRDDRNSYRTSSAL